ncbi:unnamed protein product [Heligmosomoides polygyrus]|uniref:Uncharacterized protein n=1 Tax=Heligmosomoides polygyrus TaxID=6339 RepID=A0A183FEE6_HELPZ|nr:unnamed protein product [Heligmosomoides polygyrus]
MGERIRLFSAGTFVTTVPPSPNHVSKTQSLNSFADSATSTSVASPSRRAMKKSRSRILQGSVVSLHNNDVNKNDGDDGHIDVVVVAVALAPDMSCFLRFRCDRASRCESAVGVRFPRAAFVHVRRLLNYGLHHFGVDAATTT